MAIDEGNQQLVADPLSFARSYQLEALEMALKDNTIVFFETGTGKTLIAIMLLRSYSHLLRKPSPHIAVFLVPTVVLVTQQSEVVALHTDLKVGKYYGEMGVDFWDEATWKQELDKYEVLVMTPQILLDALRHTFLRLDQIKVLIFDECHNARGKHQYACIMTEFYHRELARGRQLPRVFGMTASPIKAKASSSEAAWKQIHDLENLMHSKVFTCESDAILNRYLPFSTPKLKFYNKKNNPCTSFETVKEDLQKLAEKHISSLSKLNVSPSVAKSATDRLKKLLSTLMFCLTELGIWLAVKAAEVYSRGNGAIFMWGEVDVNGERVIKAFSSDALELLSAHLPTGLQLIHNDLRASMTNGYLTSKIICLVETLLEYREQRDLRCIVFVERIVTAIVIRILLNELLPEVTGWRTEYTAGNNSRFQSQSRKEQNKIVDELRKGTVNIIIATSMLEEGLDVQSCNLVIRFDLSATICSFIQSRGRARMQNSDFVCMVKSDDHSAIARVNNYLASGSIMRQECLSHANLPCEPLAKEMHGEPWYEVEKTGALVTLSSSTALLHYYCSRLPSDRYFKPYPLCTVDKILGTCTIRLPHGCPIRTITVSGTKSPKQHACLEACKELHKVGALTDNLVPDIVEEEAEPQEFGYEPYLDEQDRYFPEELIGYHNDESKMPYYCYLLELEPNFQYDVKPQNIVLAVHKMLNRDLGEFGFDLNADRGKMIVNVNLVGKLTLTPSEVALCQQFQVKLFNLLLKRNLDKLHEEDEHSRGDGSVAFNYLLIPALGSRHDLSIDWRCISSVLYQKNAAFADHSKCSSAVHTKNGLVCHCMIENSLVCTPHNGFLYCVNGTLDGVRGDTYFSLKDKESITYKAYYMEKHNVSLEYEQENLLRGKHIFTVHNNLQRCRTQNKKEPSYSSCELPPEICLILMSPISISTVYSFSFLPSLMHRIESLAIASNLKSIPVGGTTNVEIPAIKVLEALTTKKCQEELHLESLETLGDSFLKYAATQQLFKTHQSRHEGLLSLKRQRVICNASLCKLGCDRKIPGFVRTEPFDLKTWTIPGVPCDFSVLKGEQISTSGKVYTGRSRQIKSKTVADVVEALIGAFLSAAGEVAALSLMVWLGIEVNFEVVPYTKTFVMNPDMHVNIGYIESLLRYKFQDASLLVEALTHGSYMRPEIPTCYQRLEFLGDAVLDYLITVHLYHNYPGLSPGLLTDLRSASVNNDCYALSAIKAGLHKQVLHLSPDLHRHVAETVDKAEDLRLVETFGWESEANLPKVLGDIIESLAGAIYVDSGHDKETVFRCMKPLLDPLVTPETLRIHPKRELIQLCQQENYTMRKTQISRNANDGLAHALVAVKARGVVHEETRSAKDRKLAERLACKAVLKTLKEILAADS
ncbi:endoribonuclease Dicer homolog 2 isoform X1 [Salvia hispanica]|uniref:endoribonuclease Dicer homolog 2 isoform X1 n=1 Tax=Salvia hispanica TaxID=49212 RepID=UPI00200920D2|nr:endoribonuclease Dicer homolog 2 isoform X1 [Salvia hispanica]XP_047956210.1 endoribonuclease Dicer homolog 2 isoform X1 [Salvia hispanica]XP_047956211.1 endoribonuclease Dicer homolog 2 isoform X1 [Salvia hispanica]XP_047956212.1 endoribonuclease Dicer homolog 2 isoform X1 [Salvia hispanica]XP_047956213.1 endoribonuclease Dicer homolog 2 isoform X1 [Salvia hispanica]